MTKITSNATRAAQVGVRCVWRHRRLHEFDFVINQKTCLRGRLSRIVPVNITSLCAALVEVNQPAFHKHTAPL